MLSSFLFCLLNVTSTTKIYTLSLHDALPILKRDAVFLPDASRIAAGGEAIDLRGARADVAHALAGQGRSEEHTSELQSLTNLVCRLLLEKKKQTTTGK